MKPYEKDPEAVLDYLVDWATYLATSETISTSTFTVPSGITKDSESNTTTTSTVWLSGGSVDTTYFIECKITTSASRTDERSFYVRVLER